MAQEEDVTYIRKEGRSTPAFNYITSQCVGTNEFSQFCAISVEDRVLVSLPDQRAFVHECDLVSDLKD